MLFKQKDLHGIRTGDITLAYRRWKKSRVNKGSIIKSSIGQLEIRELSIVAQNDITEEDAINAGFASLSELNKNLNAREEGKVYRISVRYHSADPRITLRSRSTVSDEEFDEIKTKLERLDKYSPRGPWTLKLLQAINDHPKLKAQILSNLLGTEKEKLKLNVRKLKNLGLTISHKEGYMISPRGATVLDMLLSE